MRTNDPPLPCSGFARLEAGFYLEHTPPLRRLKHLVDRSQEHQAPGITPAAEEVPRLVMVVTLTFTSLAGVTRRAIVVCPRFRNGIVSRVTHSDFEGQKPKAPLYPSTMVLRGSAPSPSALTGKPFQASHG